MHVCANPAKSPTANAAASVGFSANLNTASAHRKTASAKRISWTKYAPYICAVEVMAKNAAAILAPAKPIGASSRKNAARHAPSTGSIAMRRLLMSISAPAYFSAASAQ